MGLGLELGLGLGLGLGFHIFVGGIELGLTGFVTSRRYRQIISAQALRETNRFTRLNADPSYAMVSRRDEYFYFDSTIFENNGSIGS